MWLLYYYMLDEYSQFMNKRYRILKGQSRMNHPDNWSSFGYTRHRAHANNIKHKTEHSKIATRSPPKNPIKLEITQRKKFYK